jgi:hypothetical protein
MAAINTVKFVKGEVTARWMTLDSGLHYRIAAFRAGVIDKKRQRHGRRHRDWRARGRWNRIVTIAEVNGRLWKSG